VEGLGGYDVVQWGVTDAAGGWEVTPPASPPQEIDLLWPGLAAQVDHRYGTWPAFPSDTLEVEVLVKERTSVGDLTEGHSTCRLTII
jgi:hypothetical protein